MTGDGPDPFDTAGLRRRVLAAWAQSPARFREDANAEDELARDAYHDRLVPELAQNAVDAAAPEPTRLLLRLDGDRLTVANTGRPLDAAGVAGLSTLRASAKRDSAHAVGRFGVGFAAVLALSRRISVGSRGSPAVLFDDALATEAVQAAGAANPSLLAELERRGGQLPVLRLPFPAPACDVPDGYDTVVTLALTSPAARDRARLLVGSLDPLLALALPGLAEVTVTGTGAGTDGVHRCRWDGARADLDGVAWLTAGSEPVLPAELWAERPAEERARAAAAGYRVQLRALVRADGGPLPAGSPQVLRAPQPTDDPLGLPVVLSLPLPLDSTRRRSLPGPLRDALLAGGGALLAELAGRLDDPLALVPVGLAAGEADALVRAAAVTALRAAPLLPGGLRPAQALVLDLGPGVGQSAADVLGEVLAGLLPASWWTRGRAAALAVLGVRRLDTAALVDLLAGLRRPAPFWAALYDALERADDPDALAALPVPLADGRTVTGPRGALLAPAELAGLVRRSAEVAAAAGTALRLVHPEAAHPLLLRLGARTADAAELLAALRPAVSPAVNEDGAADPAASAELVVDLVAAGGGDVEAEPWLGELALPGHDGGWWPARSLVHPRAPMASLVDPTLLTGPDPMLGLLADPLAGRHPPAVWEALGVLTTVSVRRVPDVVLRRSTGPGDDLDDDDLDDLAGYHRFLLQRLAGTGADAVLEELVAVRDLDLIGDWPAALALLAADRGLRAAVLEPARAGGRTHPSYTCWWLSRHPVLDGRLPGELAVTGADPLLDGLYDPAPAGLDAGLAAAIGCVRDLDALLADPPAAADLLDRLGDADRPVGAEQARRLYRALAVALDRLADPPSPPLTVRTVDAHGGVGVTATVDAVVVDSPDLLGVSPLARVPVAASAAAALARLLGTPLASTLLAGLTGGGPGRERPVPAAARGAAGRPDRWPDTWWQVEDLTVAGVAVGWRAEQGRLLARDEAGLARALAWDAGCWSRRAAIAERLAAAGSAQLLSRLAGEDELEDDPDDAPGDAPGDGPDDDRGPGTRPRRARRAQ